MSTSLDMALDDLIKSNKKSADASNFRGRGRGRGSSVGPARRLPNRSRTRSAPYSVGKTVLAPGYNAYADQMAAYSVPAARASSIETGTKLYISNLDYGVSNEDIKELFSEVGELKRCSIHYDRSGRSKGTAEVFFARRENAIAAVKRYNNVQLDGKPMKIEIIGTNIQKPVGFPLPPVANVVFGNINGFPRSGPRRGGSMIRPRGGGRGQSRGRGRGRGRGEHVSAAALDADLDKYHSEAMQIN